jgi:Zn-dependent M28 family amino/carboxypeptidase
MNSVRRVMVAAAVLAITTAAAAPSSGAPDTISPKRLSAYVKVLGSNAFEGRRPGTPGGQKTVKYIVKQFKALGLEPGGENGTWFQNVPVTVQRLSGIPSMHVMVGGRRYDLMGGQDAIVLPRSRLAHVKIVNAPIVFVGYGVHRPARGWNDFSGIDVRGKIIIELRGAPKKGPSSDDYDAYASIRAKDRQAVEQGAAGMLTIGGDERHPWFVELQRGHWPAIEVQPKPGDPAVTPPLTGEIRRAALEELLRRAGYNLAQLEKDAATPGFHARGIAGISLSVDYRMTRKVVHTPSVIARISGKSHPDQVVIYSAHWDHLGRGRRNDYIGRNVNEPPSDDDIYNGAVDNGSGVACILEIARAFKAGPRPDRSVEFIAFTEEEPGLLGSQYYVRHPIYPLEKTVADFTIDTVPLAPIDTISVIGGGKTDLEDILGKVVAEEGLSLLTGEKTGNYYRRSDHYEFAKAGVPVLMLGGRRSGQGAEQTVPPSTIAFDKSYMPGRYHHVVDEWSPKWDFRGAAQIASALYGVGRELAFSETWPAWKPGVRFKHLHHKR